MTATMTPPIEQRAPVEWRSASVAEVDMDERIITLVAVPYNEETVVEYRGRMVTESVLPGAFDGVERRVPADPSDIDTEAPREPVVRVNLDHDSKRPIGKAIRFHPSRAEGLVSELKISRVSAGNDTLELARDGVYGASVGMAVRQSDQRWSDGGRRRQIVRAFLDHIALTSSPAYLGAQVLSVRSANPEQEELWTPPATPRLDEAMAYTAEIAALLERVRS